MKSNFRCGREYFEGKNMRFKLTTATTKCNLNNLHSIESFRA